MSKYGNKKIEADGYVFDSRAEFARYQELRLLARAGEIEDLVVHPAYELLPAFSDRTGKRHAPIRYVADFSYRERGQGVVEDVKGMSTAVFRVKAKLFLRWYSHLDLRIVKA